MMALYLYNINKKNRDEYDGFKYRFLKRNKGGNEFWIPKQGVYEIRIYDKNNKLMLKSNSISLL